jgi:hypothetical protein
MTLKKWTMAAAIVGACCAASLGDTVLLNPSKDNTLIQTVPGTQELSNGQGDIFVGRTNQNGQDPPTISIRHGLVAFNLASIPAGSTITAVSLTMRDVMGLNGDISIDLHTLLKDWGEGASFQNGGMGANAQTNDATWYNTFYNTAIPGWTNPGGDYTPAVSATTIVADQMAPPPTLPPGSQFTWSSAQMIADVQNWLDDPSMNFGWLMKATDETKGQTAKRFNSGESTTSPNVAPVLSVTFVVPEPSSWLLLALGTALCGMRIVRRRSALVP